jgi:hypothetical protein
MPPWKSAPRRISYSHGRKKRGLVLHLEYAEGGRLSHHVATIGEAQHSRGYEIVSVEPSLILASILMARDPLGSIHPVSLAFRSCHPSGHPSNLVNLPSRYVLYGHSFHPFCRACRVPRLPAVGQSAMPNAVRQGCYVVPVQASDSSA